jgi:hypothetical protein
MGVWRFIVTLYGEEQVWMPEIPREWPDACDFPPCDICQGRLTRRQYEYPGKDDVVHTGYRYTLTHYGRRHDAFRVLRKAS